jgi:PKD repeat protein/endonuclease/exonuclease/phosphatase family metal-dependent hydrolase
LALAFVLAAGASAQTVTLRIVSYNIEADINGYTTARPGLITPSGGGTVQQGGVLEGIGEEIVGNDPAQPIDILALQETTSNPTTVAPIVDALNTYYNAPGMYAYSSYQATESGNNPSTGNGPNALIYNTTTVQLVASVPVDPPGGKGQLGSASGMYREVMRYLLAPAGVTPTAGNEFYIYVSHYKAGTTASDLTARTGEATIIRNDAASNLPANARVLYVGDFNLSTSSESSYQIMVASNAPNGIAQGQGIDVMNLSGASGVDWSVNSLLSLKTESATNLRYRDDFHVMTTNVYYGTPGGLAYVPGTYHVFGNNGTTPYRGSLNSGSNTSLTNLQAGAPISAAQLYLDLTTASDHLPVVADYVITASGPSLAVSPLSGLASTGGPGGPFSPAGQTYTLTNTGTGALNWTASNTANWLTLSATGGTLEAGAGTNVVVSINSNAITLVAGAYSETVTFTNTNNGAGNTARPANLIVAPLAPQLSLTPASGFNSSGSAGGPFTPTNQTYYLTNAGAGTLLWTASNTSAWLTLSAASGALDSGAGTSVTASINAMAQSLPAGNYSDTVSFINLNNGAGNSTRPASLTVTSFGFYDDFSTFASGKLVGQSNWVQYSSQAATPLQVSSGQVIIPGGQTTDTQDAYKNFAQTNGTVFYGLILTVTSAVNSTAPTYFTALYTGNNASGNANFRLSAKASNASLTNFVLGGRITGQSGDPYTFGSTTLAFRVQYRVILQAPVGYTNMLIYVNPTSTDLASQAVYATNPIGSGTVPTSVGCFVLSQYGTTSIPSDGVAIGKVVVSDNFAAVYNALTPVVPPLVASFTANPTNGPSPLSVAFSDTSTGSITNRLWAFGDGATTNTTSTSVSHVYAAGTYGVTLVASGPGGASTNSQPNYIAVLTPFESWQIANFGSTTNPAAAPATDPDTDGMSNWGEFLVGTDPKDPASVFRIASIVPQGSDLLITWTMGAGRTNVLQQMDDLTGAGTFTDVFTVLTAGSVTNYLDVGAATNSAPRYYRVRLGP